MAADADGSVIILSLLNNKSKRLTDVHMSSSISVDLSKHSSNVHSCCLLKYLPDGMIERVEAWAFLRMSLFEDDKFARRQGLGLKSSAFSISIVVELWALGSGLWALVDVDVEFGNKKEQIEKEAFQNCSIKKRSQCHL